MLEDQRGRLPPFLREMDLVFIPSALRARELGLSIRAERGTKAFVLEVDGKEVATACSFLLASPNPVPSGWQKPLCV